MDIAARLFAAEGLDRTSLQDFADEAQLARAAVDRHVPDKARLYEAVAVARLAENDAQVPAAADPAPAPPEEIRAPVRASARRIDEDRVGWLAASHIAWSPGAQDRRPALAAGRDRVERRRRTPITEGPRHALAPDLLRDRPDPAPAPARRPPLGPDGGGPASRHDRRGRARLTAASRRISAPLQLVAGMNR